MLEKPTSFRRRVHATAGGGNPTDVDLRYRFFNDSNDMADAEAYGSQDGVTYHPVALQPGVVPHSARETYRQFDPVPDPKHVMVILHRNAEPMGPFYLSHDRNILIVETTMMVDPATQQGVIELGGWDEDGMPIPFLSFPF